MGPAEEIPPEIAHRAFYRQPVWKRVVVIAAGPAVNFVLAFLILWGYFGFATLPDYDKPPTPVIAEIQPGSPGEGRLRPGDRLVAVDGRRGSTTELRQQISSH